MGSLSDRINILALTESARQVLFTEMLPSYHVQNAGETSSEGIYVSSLYWPFLRCELRSAEPKVFGIGLTYCGFTQLAEVLSSFDIHTIEHPLGLFLIDRMEAAVGGSVSLDFERLDALYPGSVFIYLRPELNGWISRCLERFQRFDSPPKDIALSTYFEKVRVALYGVTAPSASQLEMGYRMFEERVNNHFRDRTDDLLTLEINDHSVASRVRDFLSRAQVIDAL
jgi:hypothetical protein